MTARLLAFVIWAAVAATAVFWGLRLIVRSPSAPPHALAAANATQPRGDLTRLLGAAPGPGAAPAVEANSRFRLVGVVAPRGGADPVGVALIAVDDKPARAYRVGAVVDSSWVVQAVHTRGASLGPRGGATALRLELPPPPAAATGTLAPPVAVAAPQVVPAPVMPAPVMPAPATPPPGQQPPQPTPVQPMQLPPPAPSQPTMQGQPTQ